MLFSTSVDPHWFKAGNCFWYEYKTGNGNVWYVVDPSAKTKRPLFDQDKLAAELTEIVKDPYTAQQFFHILQIVLYCYYIWKMP